jgi:hypothetical protein
MAGDDVGMLVWKRDVCGRVDRRHGCGGPSTNGGTTNGAVEDGGVQRGWCVSWYPNKWCCLPRRSRASEMVRPLVLDRVFEGAGRLAHGCAISEACFVSASERPVPLLVDEHLVAGPPTGRIQLS